MLLFRITAFGKITMVEKLVSNPIKKYSQEANADRCHTEPSNRPPHPTTLEAIQHLIRISFDINRAESLNETSMSIHKYLPHGGLPPEVVEDTHISKNHL